VRLATVPTRDRHADLADCLKAIGRQVDMVIVVDTGSTPPIKAEDYGPNVRVLYTDPEPVNLSRWWNLGAEVAASYAGGEPFDLAYVNDDAVVPDGWLEAVAAAMREHGGAAGCSAGDLISAPLVHREPGPVDVWLRLAGHAFVLRGEVGLRADERFRWWFGDSDLDMKARLSGGTVIVPGYPVEHRHPNEQMMARPELMAQTRRDETAFREKWGSLPY
jgi:GT2 family glycosyltransferase